MPTTPAKEKRGTMRGQGKELGKGKWDEDENVILVLLFSLIAVGCHNNGSV